MEKADCSHLYSSTPLSVSFLNTTIIDWNQLPADLLAPFPCNLSTFRKRAKKVVATKGPK
jgi:hypothetical protein